MATAVRDLAVMNGQAEEPATFNSRQLDLIKTTIAPGLDDDQLALFVEVARRTGLDPFGRQIYAVLRSGKMTIQTGIDGYRAIAARTGALAGIDEAIYDVEDAKHPNKATVTVYRIVRGVRCAFTASARWSEYKPASGGMWDRMPYLMLGKCAESLALRKAFPAEISGVYTREEMDQADSYDAPAPVVTHAGRIVNRTTGEVLEPVEHAVYEAEMSESLASPFAQPEAPITWESLRARAHALKLSDSDFKDEMKRQCGGKTSGYTAADRRAMSLYLRRLEDTAAELAAAKAEDAAVTFEAVDASDEPDNGDPDLLRKVPALKGGKLQ